MEWFSEVRLERCRKERMERKSEMEIEIERFNGMRREKFREERMKAFCDVKIKKTEYM